MQPVGHRRPEYHQQLAGRRRHLPAWLEPQHADRQHPHLPRNAGPCRVPSTSAAVRRRRRVTVITRFAAPASPPRHHCAHRAYPMRSSPMCRSTLLNGEIPFQFNTNVHIHHNQIIDNASIGDALFSGSTAGGPGGVTVSAGLGQLRAGSQLDRGQPDLERRRRHRANGRELQWPDPQQLRVVQSANNPTLPVDGGGIVIMGAQEDRTLPSGHECGGTHRTSTARRASATARVRPGDRFELDSRQQCEDGSGGGLRLRQTNGTEVAAFLQSPQNWYGSP